MFIYPHAGQGKMKISAHLSIKKSMNYIILYVYVIVILKSNSHSYWNLMHLHNLYCYLRKLLIFIFTRYHSAQTHFSKCYKNLTIFKSSQENNRYHKFFYGKRTLGFKLICFLTYRFKSKKKERVQQNCRSAIYVLSSRLYMYLNQMRLWLSKLVF